MIQSRKCLRRWMLAGMCLLCAVALTGLAAQVVGAGCDEGCVCDTKYCMQSAGGIVSYSTYDAQKCEYSRGPGAFNARPENLIAGQVASIMFHGISDDGVWTLCPCNANLPPEDWQWGSSAGGVFVMAQWQDSDFDTYCNHCE